MEKALNTKVDIAGLPKMQKELIKFVNKDKIIDGKGVKKPNLLEMNERKFRADSIDGLRPLKKYRKKINFLA